MKILSLSPQKEIISLSHNHNYTVNFIETGMIGVGNMRPIVHLPYKLIEIAPTIKSKKTTIINNLSVLREYLLQATSLPPKHELSQLLRILKSGLDPTGKKIQYAYLPEKTKEKVENPLFEDAEDYSYAQMYAFNPKRMAQCVRILKNLEQMCDSLEQFSMRLPKFNEELKNTYKVNYLKDNKGVEVDLVYLAKTLKISGTLKKRVSSLKEWSQWADNEENFVSISLNTQALFDSSFARAVVVPELADYKKCYAFLKINEEGISFGNWKKDGLEMESSFEKIELVILSEESLRQQLKLAGAYEKEELLIACYENGHLKEAKPLMKTPTPDMFKLISRLEKYHLEQNISPSKNKNAYSPQSSALKSFKI